MIIRVEYFDGIYQCVRVCIYLGKDRYLVKDQHDDGSEFIVMNNGKPYHNYSSAIKLMEEVMQ